MINELDRVVLTEAVPRESLENGDVGTVMGVRVTPLTPGLRIWAFVSVTNNETQHVTTITPQ